MAQSEAIEVDAEEEVTCSSFDSLFKGIRLGSVLLGSLLDATESGAETVNVQWNAAIQGCAFRSMSDYGSSLVKTFHDLLQRESQESARPLNLFEPGR